MRVFLTSITWALLCLATAAHAAPSDAPLPDFGWRSVFRCGPNSLYVLLTMQGFAPDYDALIARTKITDRGVSVAELVRVAGVHGLPLAPLRAEASALVKLPLPALVHFHNSATGAGHYVVLLSCNRDDSFTILECTQGEMQRLPRGDFLDRWSGVALVRQDEWEARHLEKWVIGSSAAVLLMLPIGLIALRRRRTN